MMNKENDINIEVILNSVFRTVTIEIQLKYMMIQINFMKYD